MTYRNKVYVAFDGDNDIRYFNMMKAWNLNPKFDFHFNDAHSLNTSKDSSEKESIKNQLRIRFSNSKLFILLIGEHTKYLTKFVKWEIEEAIKLGLPIIAVNLNGSRDRDSLAPSLLLNELAIFVPFEEKIIEHAMENWPDEDKLHRQKMEFSNYHYVEDVYKNL